MKEIVIATQNKHKTIEFKNMLEPLGYTVFTLHDYPDIEDIPETGVTFEENALIKAKTLSQLLGKNVIADDSGLEVDALNGAPGVYSARYAGEDVSYDDNNRLLLANMKDSPNKSARFVTTICLYIIGAKPRYFSGYLHGTIAETYRGSNGFGYDPIFVLADGRHLAELELDEKNTISHRANALRKLIQHLKTDNHLL